MVTTGVNFRVGTYYGCNYSTHSRVKSKKKTTELTFRINFYNDI